MIPPPRVPWQITGNHWVTVPCIHPADASIHAVSVVHAGMRGAIEFAGNGDFVNGEGDPLIRIAAAVDGVRVSLGAEGIAWERESGWIPSFACRIESLNVRGVICAPHARDADVSGFVVMLNVENRGSQITVVDLGLEGTLGHRQSRVRTPRRFEDSHHAYAAGSRSVVLEGLSPQSPIAIAIGSDDTLETSIEAADDPRWKMSGTVELSAGQSTERCFYVAVGQERDGAEAVLAAMRRKSGSALIDSTRKSLREMEPATGSAAADRLIARHVFFAYFCSVARAIDDAHVYVARSRIPWNGHGLTVRDWEALTWVLPAVQLVDKNLARDLLLRMCDLHGYAPGAGVHYIDGSMFEPGFSLEGAAAFPIAVDEYILQTGDDKIVEEPLLAESLYNANDDIAGRRHQQLALYSTEVNPDGTVPEFDYTTHGNAVVALALDVLKHTLDEKTADKVEDPATVRAALLRHFTVDGPGGKQVLVASSSLDGIASSAGSPTQSMYWLPYYDLLGRDDSLYRRTVKRLDAASPVEVFARCARVLGPSGGEALEWLRRAPLDNGVACEIVDEEGRAISNGGDAALSGLIASTAWYAVHALGVNI